MDFNSNLKQDVKTLFRFLVNPEIELTEIVTLVIIVVIAIGHIGISSIN